MNTERKAKSAECWAQQLIRIAARRTPGELSGRLEEEWLADLSVRQGRWSSLRYALGCFWAANVISHEHRAMLIPVSAAGGRVPPWGSPAGGRGFWRRCSTLMVVAGLHVAVFYALAVGLNPTLVKTITTPFTTHIIDPPPRATLPPRIRPDVTPTKIEESRLDTDLRFEPDKDAIIGTPPDPDPSPARIEPLRSDPGPPVTRVTGGPGAGFPSPDDYYPSAAIHMGESGAATVEVCVDRRGRLTSQPSLIQSTGSSRLDGGALTLAKAGSGHYRATTVDGKPVESCYPMRIRFNLKN